MSDEIFFDGVKYISASDAASSSDLTRDYVARLCRGGKVRGRRIGTHWYVDQDSFQSFLVGQHYARSMRKESLTRERIREYHGESAPRTRDAPRAMHRPDKPHTALAADVVHAHTIRAQMANAFASRGHQTMAHASRFVQQAPTGLTHAALQTLPVQTGAHLSTITPLMEFVHKVIALTLTLILTLGTYALVDSHAARFAADSMRHGANSITDSYRAATGGDIGQLADRAQAQVAAAAEDPAGAFASLESILTVDVPDLAASIAHTFNTLVDDVVYAILFPADFLRSTPLALGQFDGSLSVEVVPHTPIDSGGSSRTVHVVAPADPAPPSDATSTTP